METLTKLFEMADEAVHKYVARRYGPNKFMVAAGALAVLGAAAAVGVGAYKAMKAHETDQKSLDLG